MIERNLVKNDISESPRESANGIFHANGFEKYHNLFGQFKKHIFIRGDLELEFGDVSGAWDYINREGLS